MCGMDILKSPIFYVPTGLFVVLATALTVDYALWRFGQRAHYIDSTEIANQLRTKENPGFAKVMSRIWRKIK